MPYEPAPQPAAAPAALAVTVPVAGTPTPAVPAWRRRVGGPAIALAAALTVVAVVVVVATVDADALVVALREVAAQPGPVAAALVALAGAFALRAWAWRRVVPELGAGHAWAALHVSLLGNRVLPLRLGEPLRVWSVVRRAGVPLPEATASVVSLRAADVVTLVGVGVGAAALATVGGESALPGLLSIAGPGGLWLWLLGGVAALVTAAGAWWLLRLRGRGRVRLPGVGVVAATALAWPLEAAVVLVVARAAGLDIGPVGAVVVGCAAVLGQVAAVTPGGFGTYEAGAVAGFVLLGHDPATGLAAALAVHAVTTGYALALGGLALAVPAPGVLGRWRLPRRRPPRPAAARPGRPDRGGPDPVVLVLPAHDEEGTVAAVVRRAPQAVEDHPVRVVVVDDGSTDATAARAASAGAEVVALGANQGLGAAVRAGLRHGVAAGAVAVAFCDADGEYAPEELADVVAPVLRGEADYVVGSRFAGRIDRMLPHRRLGNQVLTAWVRWLSREPVTDGQSGYRALSATAAAHAEIVHDYNYAQVLTLDLLGKGYRYAEVPISYSFRRSGRSFVRLGRYLARVVPAVHRELNTAAPPADALGRPGPRGPR